MLDIMRDAGWMDYSLLIGGILLQCASGALVPFNSFVLKGICDTLISGHRDYVINELNMEQFTIDVLYHCNNYLILGMTQLAVGYFSNVFLFAMCERRIQYIREKYLRAVMRQDMAWFDTQQVGALTGKMSSGVERIRDGIGDKLGQIFSGVGAFISGVSIGLYLRKKQYNYTERSSRFFIFQLGDDIGNSAYDSYASGWYGSLRKTADALAHEVIASIRTVMAFNAQPAEIKRYEKELKTAQKLGIKKVHVLALAAALPLSLLFLAMAICFWYGTTLVLDGKMSPGSIFGVFWAVQVGNRRLGETTAHLGATVGAKLAAADIFAVIDRVPTIDSQQEDGLFPQHIEGRLTFNEVHFSYPSRPTVEVLKNISFEVDKGETLAVVGHSGCGKSTITGLLLRYYEKTAGRIALDGIPLSECNIRWLRSVVGIVQQEPVIFAGTVAENVRMGDDTLTDEEVMEACRLANALGFIRKLGKQFVLRIQGGHMRASFLFSLTVNSCITDFSKMKPQNNTFVAFYYMTSNLANQQLHPISHYRYVWGQYSIETARDWFRRFRDGDQKLEDFARSGHLSEVGNDRLRQLVEAYPRQTTHEQKQILSVHFTSIADHLPQLGNMYKGFNTVIGEGAVQLSGGQKQRIAIARALVRKPQILVLDEATSALDVESEQAVQEALDRTRKDRTTICIAHRLSTIQNADKIIVLDKGSIVEMGNHKELMAIRNGVYRSMIKAQEITKGEEEDLELGALKSTGTERDRKKQAEALEEEAEAQQAQENESAEVRWSLIRGRKGRSQRAAKREAEKSLEEDATEASFREILSYIRPELPMTVAALIVTLLRGAIWPIFSVMYGKLFLMLSHPDPDTMATASLVNSALLMGLSISALTMTFSSGSLSGIIGEKMAMRMRMDVFKNIMRQDASYFDDPKHNTGTLTARLSTDAPNVKVAIDHRLATVVQGVISLIGGIVVSFYYGWNVALCGMTTGSILAIVQTTLTKYLKIRGEKDLESAVEADRIVNESISNTKTIQALCKEDYMHKMYCNAAQEPHRRALIRGHWQALLYGMTNSFFVLNFAIAFAYGLWLIRNGGVLHLRFSSKLKVNEALNLAGIMMAASYFPEFIRARISAGIMFTMMRSVPKIDNMSNVGKRPSIDNYDIRGLSIRHVRNQMAVVGQEPTLFNMTVRENITYGLDECSDREIEDAARLANIHDFITGLPEGYNTKLGDKGSLLSVGQKQRIAIARAIIRDPKILLLDEATSALDSESEKVVQEALDKARQGRTCLVIAHRLPTIQSADMIVVCREGRIAEQGTHQALLAKKGIYYRFVVVVDAEMYILDKNS
ncbi:ABC transporter transmembrane region [Oesophagostomum dentatum]|uniref:ABC transporter transmembrane region n=1 Tax=Oesophagostomum dentatum TaxID=61180 RepID=A0A0B1TPD5_OESDE|nr:ABC transporter transmembrane region [Oesophagostomum dentatum]